jgi:hypothetical protein
MATRVFKLDELASRIATYLLTISPRSTVALALTCRALEVPALRALWETQCSFNHLIMRVLSTDAFCFTFPGRSDLCLLVRPVLSFSRHIGYLSITINPTGVKPTTLHAGVE